MNMARLATEKQGSNVPLPAVFFQRDVSTLETTMDMEWDPERMKALAALEGEWRDNRRSPKRWDIIRRAYAVQMPGIMASRSRAPRARTNPYFLDWDFTPIEFSAWCAIRQIGLPFYPQVPVGPYFLDFGDPYFKIGIELDGKAYHERERDTRRDTVLWDMGWRIFRIAGKCTMPLRIDSEIVDGFDPDISDVDFDEWLCETEEGVIWSLALVYYDVRCCSQRQLRSARCSLKEHAYIEFPLHLNGSDPEDLE